MNDICNPINSAQITDVSVPQPSCMCTKGNTLNDWLTWITDNMCECDWTNTDISSIQSLLSQEPTNLNLCVIVDSLIEAISALKEEKDSCCVESEYSIAEQDWTPTRPLKAVKRGRQVILTGAVQANVSYTSDIATLPSDLFPSTNLYIPVAHDFSPSSTYNVFLRILPTGKIRLYFTGTAPAYSAARTVYLDGVTFFID